MKLAVIEHERCGEHDCTNYVLIPDNMTKKEFRLCCEKAQEEYIKYAEEWNNTVKVKDPGWQANYKDFPDLLVKDVEAEFNKRKAEYKEYHDKEYKSRYGFVKFLKIYGILSIYEYDEDDTMKIDLDWGHNHGKSLDYKMKNTGSTGPYMFTGKETESSSF